MATVANKVFMGLDACGTDGTDINLMKAIYRVLDSDGFTYESLRIAKTIHDAGVDPDINAALKAAGSF
jgi:hypothetical protein